MSPANPATSATSAAAARSTPPRTRVKVCGVRDAATAMAAASAGADAIGLMFVEASSRCIDLDAARAVIARLPGFVEPVAVFVDERPERIRKVAAALGLRTVQLHGSESPADVAALAPLRVIKALAFADAREAAAAVASWRGVGNLAGILFDAPPPPDAPTTGGTGQRFDWHGLARLQGDGALAELPAVLLAGGLTPTNVAEAVATARPYAVDVSSGVESAPGVKSAELIDAFCRAVRRADRDADAAARA
ncbi:MAG: phosphoribosylanthranilate isomerase [Phycisphaeraceae bacterium]